MLLDINVFRPDAFACNRTHSPAQPRHATVGDAQCRRCRRPPDPAAPHTGLHRRPPTDHTGQQQTLPLPLPCPLPFTHAHATHRAGRATRSTQACRDSTARPARTEIRSMHSGCTGSTCGNACVLEAPPALTYAPFSMITCRRRRRRQTHSQQRSTAALLCQPPSQCTPLTSMPYTFFAIELDDIESGCEFSTTTTCSHVESSKPSCHLHRWIGHLQLRQLESQRVLHRAAVQLPKSPHAASAPAFNWPTEHLDIGARRRHRKEIQAHWTEEAHLPPPINNRQQASTRCPDTFATAPRTTPWPARHGARQQHAWNVLEHGNDCVGIRRCRALSVAGHRSEQRHTPATHR